MRLNAKSVLFLLPFLALGALYPAVVAMEGDKTATYSNPKPNEFMTTWLVLSPIPVLVKPEQGGTPDEHDRREAFNKDFLADQGGEAGVNPSPEKKVAIAGREYEWRLVKSASDVVSLAPDATAPSHVIAYAAADLELPEARSVVFGLGSDDGVKVWVNGQLVHENWAARPVEKDEDLFTVRLNKGVNRVLLKIQNQDGAWGFSCRTLDGTTLNNLFVAAAGRDALDQVKKLVQSGVDINFRASNGLTALQSARVHGRKEIAEFLIAEGADSSLPAPPPEDVIDRLLSETVKENYPGLAVLVAKDGKVVYRKGFGLACVENRVPVTPETRFRIGSITKQFTAAAILRLREQGKISLEDKLSKFIPDFPRGDEVTIHHLLSHTSGIHSYTNKPDFMGTVTVPSQPEELINSFKNDPFDFNPGQSYLYNNSGFFLLGYIIQKLTGESYADHLRKTFFEPLGMHNTGVHNSRDIIEHEAYGYSWEDGKIQKALNWDMSKAGGAGALYSTVDDLLLWNEALFGGRVISDESLKLASTPVITASDTEKTKEDGYGYGLMISKLRGLQVIGHGGGLHGFSSYLSAVPTEHFTFVALANSAPGIPDLSTYLLSIEVAQLYLGEKMQAHVLPAVDTSVSPSTYPDYEGFYDYGHAVLTVTRQGNQLFAQLSGQPAFQIFPKAKDVFFWKVVEAEVTFVRDEKGQVVKAVHRQAGRTFNSPKFVQSSVVKVDPAVYDAYVGKYDYGRKVAIMTITKEGDHLFAQLTGQPKFEIFPKSESEFFWKVVNAEVRFVKDGDGKVIKAIHRQSGSTLEAPRME